MLLYREISKILAVYLSFLAATLLVPLSLAAYYQFLADPASHPQPYDTASFALTIVVCIGIAAGLWWIGRTAIGRYFKREALALVVSIWFVTAIVGGLPFYFSGTFDNMVDCYFEAMSGLTTTGATVMHPKNYDPISGAEIPVHKVFSDVYQISYTFDGTVAPVRDAVTGKVVATGVEAVGKALLFWRSLMQWLGGMGIVVLLVAVLPALGVGGKALYQAEVPGPTKETITPRIKETASLLWKIYLGFSIAEVALLMVTNSDMPLFDAVTVTFSNLSTGGFTTRNGSIAAYRNPATEWVVIAFMVVGSINFALYFQVLRGKIYRLFEPEFLTYMAILFLSSYLAIWNLVGSPEFPLVGSAKGSYSLWDAVRYGCFQSISAQTSTGFATADYDKWPFINQVQMLLVMFVGSMAGSTGGGIKIIRHVILFRVAQYKVESMFRPRAVHTLRVGDREISADAANTVLCYFLIITVLSAVATLLFTLTGIDPETALATTACMINNIGIAFRMGGPTESFAFLSPLMKIFSTIWMVMGRLELFAVLVVLTPAFWKE